MNSPGLEVRPVITFDGTHEVKQRKTSIYSDSNEIQKNIIAKAVLGL